jgi:hypothetical protein
MKICTKCKEEKSIDNFSSKKSSKDGLFIYCKNCVRKINIDWKIANKERTKFNQKERYRRNRKRLNDYKKTLKCSRCSENHPRCLEFHHRDPSTKLTNITYVGNTWGWKRLMEEINKCEVLCANCHRKETFKDEEY